MNITQETGLRSLENIIDDVHKAGFKVLNLFELDSGKWRANLRLDLKFEFAEEATAKEALVAALRNVLKQELRETQIIVSTRLRIEDLDL